MKNLSVCFRVFLFVPLSLGLWPSAHAKERSSSPQVYSYIGPEGLTLRAASSNLQATANLRLAIKVDDRWLMANTDQDCQLQGQRLSCQFLNYGNLILSSLPSRYHLEFEASQDTEIQAMALIGQLTLPRVQGWLSNGFQSWSQTGVITVPKAWSENNLQHALRATGEEEVYRRGKELSWWYSYIGSETGSFLAGVSRAEAVRSYVQFMDLGESQYKVRLVSGADGAIKLAAGDSISEDWFISLGPDLQPQLDSYAATIPSRRKAHKAPSQIGWNSWYGLWDKVTETTFEENIDFFEQNLAPRLPAEHGPITMTLDDGWEEKWGDWSANAKFPSGIESLAKKTAAKGYDFGLWFAPLLAEPNSKVYKEHPDWFVQGASYKNPTGKTFLVLDITHPQVVEHLTKTIHRFVSWGVRLLKTDFLFAGTLEGGRRRTITGMQAYQETMQLLRKAAGEDIFIVAVGAPPIASFPFVDAWRVGGDIAFQSLLLGWPHPAPSFIGNQARSVAGRQPLCQATLCDADPALLRTLGRETVYAGAWVAAATGGAMVYSDDLPRLDKKRLDWAFDEMQFRNGLSGKPATLLSYFPTKVPNDLNSMKDILFTAEQCVPEHWRMQDGTELGLNLYGFAKLIKNISVPKHSSRVLGRDD